MRLILILVISILFAPPVFSESIDTSAGPVSVTQIMQGLDEPWGLAFLPGSGFLVTERKGRLTRVNAAGQRVRVTGVPKVVAGGQGGLLDVMVPRDFAQSRQVFLSYSKSQRNGSGTALVVGRLSPNGNRLTNLTTIFEMAGSNNNRHFGGRIVEGANGFIFLTIGERGQRDEAQNRANHNGTVIRIARNGAVPGNNPFTGIPNVRPEIWSYGHRNPQGAALDLKGRLWINEHGAKGGDEVNRVIKGQNFGWPVVAYGRHYSGAKIGIGTSGSGMKQPAHYWDPSIAPSGMMIYSGKLWPAWRGNFFIGSLKFNYISRLDPNRGWREETIRNRQTIRVRDVREAPDGSIWFLSVGNGAIYRMVPG